MNEDLFFTLWIIGVILFWVVLILVIILLRKRQKKKHPEQFCASKYNTVKYSLTKHTKSASDPEAEQAAYLKACGLTIEVLDRILERLKANTRCESLVVIPTPGTAEKLTDSKIGGFPYWDFTEPYPTDTKGVQLVMLAQINLAQLPANDQLPREGLLQFFIRPDDLYGMSFDAYDDQDGFRVILHRTIDFGITEEMVQAKHYPTSLIPEYQDQLPHNGEFVLSFRRETTHIDENDVRFEAELRRAAKDTGFSLPEDFSLYRAVGKDERYKRWWGMNEGSRMFGYPYFVQEDPRSEDTPYDTLLFQLDSYFSDKNIPENILMWGDAGVANFFIRHEDLEAKRFDRVCYTWDCG